MSLSEGQLKAGKLIPGEIFATRWVKARGELQGYSYFDVIVKQLKEYRSRGCESANFLPHQTIWCSKVFGDSLVWLGELVNYNYCDSSLDNHTLSFCMYQLFDMPRKPNKLKTFGYVSHYF